MRKFVIVTDSCSDLDKARREKYGVDYIPMYLTYDDKTVPASLDWEYIPVKDFYDMMRKGTIFKTAQITPDTYREKFENYLKDGYDILSVSCSSALSTSYDSSVMVAKSLMEKYPESKIVCVDSRNSCWALGFMCITASMMREQGKTIEEIAEFLEENKQRYNQISTVEDLSYLKRAGRVSLMSALFGGLLQVKPIIISDAKGQNLASEKVKGRKNSVLRIVEIFKQVYQKSALNKIAIAHADCEEDCKELVEMLKSAVDLDGVEIIVEYLGPIIGASTGPGTLAVYCYGEEVTVNADK